MNKLIVLLSLMAFSNISNAGGGGGGDTQLAFECTGHLTEGPRTGEKVELSVYQNLDYFYGTDTFIDVGNETSVDPVNSIRISLSNIEIHDRAKEKTLVFRSDADSILKTLKAFYFSMKFSKDDQLEFVYFSMQERMPSGIIQGSNSVLTCTGKFEDLR